MYFRFASAVILVVLVSLAGVAIEKRTLESRREVSRQYYRLEVLRDAHAGLRLRTQKLGAPVRLIEEIEAGRLEVQPTPKSTGKEPKERMPLLRWQRPGTAGR